MAPSNASHAASEAVLFSPLNIALIAIFAFAVLYRMRAKPTQTLPPPPPPTIYKTYTPPELLPFNGLNGAPVYLAVKGKVFDVSAGRNFYGPGGPYENFAGRDATRGLACQSFDEDMLTKDLNGPLDDLNGLGNEELENLQGWWERFTEKYLVVGDLVSVADAKK